MIIFDQKIPNFSFLLGFTKILIENANFKVENRIFMKTKKTAVDLDIPFNVNFDQNLRFDEILC